MTIITPSIHHDYCVIPYVLFSAPVVFQCLLNNGLLDLLDKIAVSYIDNILTINKGYVTAVVDWPTPECAMSCSIYSIL